MHAYVCAQTFSPDKLDLSGTAHFPAYEKCVSGPELVAGIARIFRATCFMLNRLFSLQNFEISAGSLNSNSLSPFWSGSTIDFAFFAELKNPDWSESLIESFLTL